MIRGKIEKVDLKGAFLNILYVDPNIEIRFCEYAASETGTLILSTVPCVQGPPGSKARQLRKPGQP